MTSPPIPFDDFAADIARRKREFSTGEVPRNSGKRRTASKRALLAAIKEAGGDW
jgi:hypothetical protein